MRIVVILLFLIISCSTAPKQTSEYSSFQGWTARRVEYLPEGSGQVSQVLLLERPSKDTVSALDHVRDRLRFLVESDLDHSTLSGETPSAIQIDYFCKNMNLLDSVSYFNLGTDSPDILTSDLPEKEKQEAMSAFANGISPATQSGARIDKKTGTYASYMIDCRYSGEMRWKVAHLNALTTFRIFALSKFVMTVMQYGKKIRTKTPGKDKKEEISTLFLTGTFIARDAEKKLDSVYNNLKKDPATFQLSSLAYKAHEDFTKDFAGHRDTIYAKWEKEIAALPTSEQKRLRDLLNIKDPDEIMRKLEELAKN